MTQPTQPRDMEILERQSLENGFRLQCRVPKDLYYFQGHFTGSPVVAGVVQLKWVNDAISQFTGKPLTLKGMEAVKFHQLLFPDQTFTMRVEQKKGKWMYAITSGDTKIASGRMLPLEDA